MKFVYNDGGRQVAGYRGSAGDCGTRALAIALDISYQTAYDLINEESHHDRKSKRKRGRGKSSARNGVYTNTMRRVMACLGWEWVPLMKIGSGCTVHMKDGEVPSKGRIIVSLSKHFAAVVDGVLHDTYDCTRGGTRCVYGYWIGEPGLPLIKIS